MDQLRRAAEEIRRGRGQLVAVVGEPGVGKSRLFYEFISSHHTHGWLTLESESVSYGKATTYLPLANLLRSYFKIESRDNVRAIQAKVKGNLLTLDEALTDTIPPVLWLLDALPEESPFLALDPDDRQRRTLSAVKAVLLRESQVQPLLIVFEDLHGIDSETQTFLDGLVESLPAAPILLAVNYRPEYRHAWGSKTYYRQLRIDALPPESADELLDSLLGEDATLPPVKQLLIARTEGNPLFLEESVRMLVEVGALTGSHGAYRLVKPPNTISVPPTVQAILAARIDRLEGEDKRLLQAAAVVGKDVPFVLLLDISDLDEDALRRALARLQATEFLYEARLFPELEYTFKHALTHEVAYQSLLQERRRALHARIVAALETQYGARLAEHIERLADHAFHGQIWDKAIDYLRQAAVKAAARSAHGEAAVRLQHALQAVDQLPKTATTLKTESDILVILGPALMAKGFYSQAVENVYRRGHELWAQLGEDSPFPVVWGLWHSVIMRGELERARELAEQLHVVALREGKADLLLQAHHSMWATLSQLGELTAVKSHVDTGLGIYNSSQHHTHTFSYGNHDPGICGRTHWGRALWLLGYPDQALRWMEEASDLARDLRHAFTTAQLLGIVGMVRQLRGEFDAAKAAAKDSLQLATEHDFRELGAFASAVLGSLMLEPGEREEAVARVKAGHDALRGFGMTGRSLYVRVLLADAYRRVGWTKQALGVVDETLREQSSELYYESEVHRLKGELLEELGGDLQESETSIRRALQIAHNRQAKSLELRAAMTFARLFGGRGHRDEARRRLAEVYNCFTEGSNTADVKDAKTLLGRS